MGPVLSAPVELIRVQRHGSKTFRCGVADMQGWRSAHEDAHTVRCDDTAGAFWVLDGHGGDGASLYSAPKLGEEFAEQIKKGQIPDDSRIEEGMTGVDAKLRQHFKENPKEESGSTVIGAFARKEADGSYTVKMINCGDSRGIVVGSHTEGESDATKVTTTAPGHLVELMDDEEAIKKNDTIRREYPWPLVQESVDHKPSHPTEKARIEAAGGHVTDDEPPRLDGNLAVSRGLGDFEYKSAASAPVAEQKVSCIPDLYEAKGLAQGSLCVLCCDGVWDVLSSHEVASLVHGAVAADANADLGDIAANIIRLSLEKNSRDNITAMVVHLASGAEWAAESQPPDEMKVFDKLLSEEKITDQEIKGKYMTFLRKAGFPPEPIACEVCGRWYVSMMQCPCKQVSYCTKQCQKKHWKKHKLVCPAVNPEKATANKGKR